MTPGPQNGFGVFFFLFIFFGCENGVLAGGFANFGCAEDGFCVVNRGGFVVKTWLETTANRPAKIFQLFMIYFCASRARRRQTGGRRGRKVRGYRGRAKCIGILRFAQDDGKDMYGQQQ
jgi:hypothetical protein